MNSRRILLLAVAFPAALFATETDTPVREALNSGARWESRAALNLSDQSDDPVSMLSVAVGYGKLTVYSDTPAKTRIRAS